MNKIKEKIKTSFNKAANTYDSASSIQQQIGNKLIKSLDKNQYSSIIDLGCGTGLTTKKLTENTRFNRFYAIDFAQNLLNIAKQKLPSDIKLITTDYDHPPKEKFCLVFSNMALQWSPSLSHTLNTIYNIINQNGTFAFSIPAKGTLRELKSKNDFQSSGHIEKLLISKKFRIKNHFTKKYTVKFASSFEALKSLKLAGTNCLFKNKQKTLNAKPTLNCESLTYNIAFFIAEKMK